MNYEEIQPTKEMVKSFITPEDGFAKTFITKLDMMDKWHCCRGLWKEELLSIIVTTYSKRLPKTANLQLLHTFAKHRGKGYASLLCRESVKKAFIEKCEYFRVSAEPESVDFYKKLGFKFCGKQKSGCQLSIFKLLSPIIEQNIFVLDSFIEKAIYSKRRGGCVEVFI